MSSGFLLIDKPADWTSHDVVGYLRRVTHIKKIGHAGTLDPFATGLLIIGIGRDATKQLDSWKEQQKTYQATIHLGATSDTQDSTGILTPTPHATAVPIEELNRVVASFVGNQTQIPPMYSAKKIAGKKLYTLAREGKTIERQPHEITVHSMHIHSYHWPLLNIETSVSVGTYVRTLAHDIGAALGVGAYCEALRRTHIGPYSVTDALVPSALSHDTWEQRLLPCELAL